MKQILRRDRFNFLFYEPAQLNFLKTEKTIPSEEQNILPCLLLIKMYLFRAQLYHRLYDRKV